MITSHTQSISALGTFQKDIPYLPQVDEFSYESFLRLYLTKDNQFFYNLLSSKVTINGELDPATYYTITITRKIPWTTIAYNEYRNLNMWWLILVTNNITNPVEFPKPGTELKILYPKFVRYVIDQINQEILK
jgi:hypothetical protein